MKRTVGKKGLLFALTMALAATPGAAHGQSWYANLTGSAEVPPTGSPASGFAHMTLSGNLLTFDLIWSGLIGGNPSAAHIHCCAPPGSSAPVAVPFPNFPSTTSGVYHNVFDLSNAATYQTLAFGGGTVAGAQATLIASFSTNNAYVNIHNTTFPGGEIRGIITIAPEPSTIVFTAMGLIGLFGVARRRRKTLAV